MPRHVRLATNATTWLKLDNSTFLGDVLVRETLYL